VERCTLTQAAHKLGVSLLTLREWLKVAGIQPITDKFDQRRKWIAFEQLALLAESHERTLHDAPTYAQLAARITVLEAQLAALKATPRHLTLAAQQIAQQEMAAPLLDGAPLLNSASDRPPQRPRNTKKAPQDENAIARNADGEYHFGEDGLTYDEQGLLTDRGFARVAEAHGARFETARQSWARSIPATMRHSRTTAVQWMLTNRRKYLLAQCGVDDCPCRSEVLHDDATN
jgi:hypothetical protein